MDPAYLPLPPFRLNLHAARLELGETPVALRPKAYALLHQLAHRPGQLLTKDLLLETVWPGRIISEGGLSELVRELRSVLGDDARAPRFIETVHGRGYRFIGAARALAVTALEGGQDDAATNPVGRGDAMAALRDVYQRAEAGIRQLIFVTGQPGIGKTTLIEAFCKDLTRSFAESAPRVAVGQCVEQYGGAEAYLPILDAISRLARDGSDPELLTTLRRLAPTWLIQLPSLLSGVQAGELERRTMGATRDRMLREMAEALECLTVRRPMLLVIEDMHWSDYSTLDLLTFLAQRPDRARLMIVASFRPVEVLAVNHPLKAIKQELTTHGRCEELPLSCLSRADVEAYLARRFHAVGGAPSIGEFADLVYRRTEGHPLFLVNVADYIASVGFQGLPDSVLASIPHSVRHMIEKQVDLLSPEHQRILTAAAVVGIEFNAASLAAALDTDDIDGLEEACGVLVHRSQFLWSHGCQRWPDGSLSGRYGFVHALYQNVLYSRVEPGRRSRMHLRVAIRQEAGWGRRAEEIAAELAVHFEAGQDSVGAIKYLAIAGERAASRCAGREAICLLKHALGIVSRIDDQLLRERLELKLCIALAVPLIQANGYGADKVARVSARVRELHARVGEASQINLVLWASWLHEIGLANHVEALRVARELQSLEATQATRIPLAHYATGCSLFWSGDFAGAVSAFNTALEVYDDRVHGQQSGLYTQDAKTVSLVYRGLALWMLGFADQAVEACQAAVAWAESLGHPFSLAFAHDFHAVLRLLRREAAAAAASGEQAAALACEYDFVFWKPWSAMMCAGASADGGGDNGAGTLISALGAYEGNGTVMGKSFFLLLIADAQTRCKDYRSALATLDTARAFAAQSGEAAFVAEMDRREGELLLCLVPENPEVAERRFLEAMAQASRQGARAWKLRAATSLARMWLPQGRRKEAGALLEPVCASFTEGYTTLNLLEARALLARVEH